MQRARIALVLVLGFMGGFTDAGSFVLASSFTGAITGNAVLAIVNLAHGSFARAGVCAAAVTSFLLGTILGRLWKTGDSRDRELTALTWPISLEILIFAVAIAAYGQAGKCGSLFFVACLSLAMGLQNGSLQHLGMVSVHSTMLTGMTTRLTNVILAPSNVAEASAERNLLLATILAFILGAVSGSLLTIHVGLAGFSLLFVPAVAAMLLSVIARPRVPESQ
jgi:uncharacterized membrane protein YoaK (UPF0700 family)